MPKIQRLPTILNGDSLSVLFALPNGWPLRCGLFPNDASLLRLVSALAAEISEEQKTGRIYWSPESV